MIYNNKILPIPKPKTVPDIIPNLANKKINKL